MRAATILGTGSLNCQDVNKTTWLNWASVFCVGIMGEKDGVCVPSDLLQYVYSFLVQCNYKKAAKALQKATEEVRRSSCGVFETMWYDHCLF